MGFLRSIYKQTAPQQKVNLNYEKLPKEGLPWVNVLWGIHSHALRKKHDSEDRTEVIALSDVETERSVKGSEVHKLLQSDNESKEIII